MFDQQPIILETDKVLLRPMQLSDVEGFKKIAFDQSIWKYMTVALKKDQDVVDYVQRTIADRENKNSYAFTVIDKATGEVAGSTRFGNITLNHSRLEIGWTWLGVPFQGTGLNKQCKFLLLSYAFEVLGLERVELKTDVLNQQSRKAMKKIGCIEEGVLRSHTIMQDKRRRDTIFYSILKPEWKTVKAEIFNR